VVRNRPRVIQIIKGLDIGGLHGGADLLGYNLAGALSSQQVDVRLCIFFRMDTPAEAKYLEQLSVNGVSYFFLKAWPGKTSLRTYYECFKNLYSILKREPADILHSHFHVGTLIAILTKILGRVRRVVRTAHVNYEWQRGWPGWVQKSAIWSMIFVLFPFFVDREAGVSKIIVDLLDRRFIARLMGKKAHLIYNAIPLRPNPPGFDSQESREAAHPHLIVGSVGRLEEQKGYSYLLNAVQLLKEDLPQAEFWIIGEGPLNAALKDEARRLDVESRVRFWGKRDDVLDLVRQMDLFVLPSVYEGLPTVVLESMSCGVPVIATDIPGTREIVQKDVNGWLAEPRSAAALAGCIQYAVDHPEIRQLYSQAAYHSLKEFDILTTAQKYADLYRRMI